MAIKESNIRVKFWGPNEAQYFVKDVYQYQDWFFIMHLLIRYVDNHLTYCKFKIGAKNKITWAT